MKQYGSEPGSYHTYITPSNTVNITPLPRALYFNTTGIVVITDFANNTVTYNVSAGQTLPFRPYLVLTTTTANTVALY
jgi:hypothetical protein